MFKGTEGLIVLITALGELYDSLMRFSLPGCMHGYPRFLSSQRLLHESIWKLLDGPGRLAATSAASPQTRSTTSLSPGQVGVSEHLFVRLAVDADDMTANRPGCPGQPDRAVAIGCANLQQACTPAAHQDTEQLGALGLKIE